MKEKRTLKWILVLASVFAVTPGLFAQRNFVEPGDPARELFNLGQKFYDQFRYADAERTFRDVVAKYSRSTIADKADYYLIRTLYQVGKADEALIRINAFPKSYPRSAWNGDVQDLKMQMTNQVPPFVRANLVKTAQQFAVDPAVIANFDVQISLMQEALRVMFRSDVAQALQITNERLKADMADPVVLSAMPLLAINAAPQGIPVLVEIARTSPNLKARRDAIYWMSQSPRDKDSVVDKLMGLLSNSNEDSLNAITFALGQIRSEKAYNALAGIVLDKTRTEKLREQALVALGQTHDPRTVSTLSSIATSDSDIRFRTEAVMWLGKIPTPEAAQAAENLLRKK